MKKVYVGHNALEATMFMAPDGQVHTTLPKEGGQVYWERESRTGLTKEGFAILESGWQTIKAYRSDRIPPIADHGFRCGKPVVLFWGHGSDPELVVTTTKLPAEWEPSWRNAPEESKPAPRSLYWEECHDGWYVSMPSPWWAACDYGAAHLRVVSSKKTPPVQEHLCRLALDACWLSLRAEGCRAAMASRTQGALFRNRVEVNPEQVMARMERQDVAYPFVRYRGRIWQFDPTPTYHDRICPLTQVKIIPPAWTEVFETKKKNLP